MTESNTEIYRLVFRGEVLDGQHPAVVRKRLGQALKLEGQKLEMLFSGQPVLVKRDADKATAARFLALFREAGARLRVLPVEQASSAEEPSAAQAQAQAETQPPASESDSSPATAQAQNSSADTGPGGLSVAAEGDLLRPEERPRITPVDVDTGHITLAPAGTDLAEQVTAPELELDLSQFSLAEAGADLGVGEWDDPPALDMDAVDFDVAPAGSDLGQQPRPKPPPAPDTSHLSYSKD